MTDLRVVLDEWVHPPELRKLSTLLEYFSRVYTAAPSRARNRWVMDPALYQLLRYEIAARSGPPVPGPGPGDTLFGIPVEVRDDGGLPHLE